MPFAAIYVPDFAVEAVVRAEPELREQAVAVVEGTPPLGKVVAMNTRAAEATVEPGMTKTQCEERLLAALGARGWEVRARSAAREQAAHAALLDAACAFSPRVEDTAADTVVLDLAGLERIFGPVAKIAREVARRCSELGLEANVAVAGNAEAAICAARGFDGVTIIAPGKEAERLGALPMEVLCSAVGGREFAGGAQSARAARAKRSRDSRQDAGAACTSAELLEIFERWGVRTFRALANLPEIAVVERLGQQGRRLQQLARGAVERPLVPAEPPLVFEESLELEYPVDLLEPLAFVLSRLLEQVCARLALRALATNEITLQLTLDPMRDIEIGPRRQGDTKELPHAESQVPNESGEWPVASNQEKPHDPDSAVDTRHPAFQRILRLPVPMCDARVFLKLLQLDLKGNPPPAPVTKVWLRAEPVQPRVAQQGLFLPAAPQPERLELTLKRMENVVADCRLPNHGGAKPAGDVPLDDRQSAIGEAPPRVGSPELLDTHRPDAFRMNKFVVEEPGAKGRRPAAENPAPGENSPLATRQSALTAVRVFRPPLRVAVKMKEERPAALECAERPRLRGDITWCAGPWRISGEWWSMPNGECRANEKPPGIRYSATGNRTLFPGWAREEWDIAVHNEEGSTLYRLYYDVAQRAWFLHGTYD